MVKEQEAIQNLLYGAGTRSQKHKVCVIGSTGGTGLQCVAIAQAMGHEVVATCRNPEAFNLVFETQAKRYQLSTRPAVMKVDVRNVDEIKKAIEGCDVVISGLSSKSGYFDKTVPVIEKGTVNIVKAIDELVSEGKVAPKRLISMSAHGTHDDQYLIERDFPWFYRVPIRKYVLAETYDDMTKMEKFLESRKDIDYTIVSLPQLFDKKFTGKFRSNCVGDCPKKGVAISRPDAAYYIVQLIDNQTSYRQKAYCAY